ASRINEIMTDPSFLDGQPLAYYLRLDTQASAHTLVKVYSRLDPFIEENRTLEARKITNLTMLKLHIAAGDAILAGARNSQAVSHLISHFQQIHVGGSSDYVESAQAATENLYLLGVLFDGFRKRYIQ